MVLIQSSCYVLKHSFHADLISCWQRFLLSSNGLMPSYGQQETFFPPLWRKGRYPLFDALHICVELYIVYIVHLHWIVMCRSGQLFSKHLCGAAVYAAGWGEAHPASICSCLSNLSFFSTSPFFATWPSSSSSPSSAGHIEAELGREFIHPAAEPNRSISFLKLHHSTSDETWKQQGRNSHTLWQLLIMCVCG